MSEEILKIIMVETDNGFYIKEDTTNAHRFYSSKIPNLYFDKEQPEETHLKSWYRLKSYPKKIQKKERDTRENQYWELRNPDMVSKALPMKKNHDELDYEDSAIVDLYKLKYTLVPGEFVDVPNKIETVLKVEGFNLPKKINFKAEGNNYKTYEVTEVDFESQFLDKLIYPEIVLHQMPARISSTLLYNIVRHHIKENIDLEYAKISSDYNFCFSVKKKAELIGPGKIQHSVEGDNLFTVSDEVNTFREFEVFEMTHERENYKHYTPIKGMSAPNQDELKEKIENYLNELMSLINMPTVKIK